jgi:hypothetical protein
MREAHREGTVADRSRDPLGGLRSNVAGHEDALATERVGGHRDMLQLLPQPTGAAAA